MAYYRFTKTWLAGENGKMHCITGRASRSTIDAWQRKHNLPSVHVEVTAHHKGNVVTVETFYT